MQDALEAGHPARRASGTRRGRAFHWFLLGGWVLMMPPVPMGTSLPPLSEWSRVKAYETSDECERGRETMRESARRTVTGNPNASALGVAAALGQLQAKCVQDDSVKPPPKP